MTPGAFQLPSISEATIMSNTSVSDSDPIALYDALRAALHKRDGSVLAHFAPDFVVHEDPGMPYGGTFHGAEHFVRLFHEVYSTFGGRPIELLWKCRDDQGHVMVYFKLSGQPEKSPEPVSSYVAIAWTFENGLAKEARISYFDTPRLSKAILGS